MLSLLMIVAAMGFVSSQSHFGGPCYLTPQHVNNNSKKNVLQLTASDCNEGTIAWHYPMGVLNIHLTLPGQSFSLCLVHTSLTMTGALHAIIDGKQVEIPLPTTDKDACTDSINNVAELLVTADTNQYYVSYIDYKFVPKLTSESSC